MERTPQNRLTKEAVLAASENFLQNPPRLILVFDNWRGQNGQDIATRTMLLRVAVASLIFHSNLYPMESDRPKLATFAGPHDPNRIAGARRMSSFFKGQFITNEKIETRETTNTTRTDLMQLRAYLRAYPNQQPAAIVTTDDHIARVAQEWANLQNRAPSEIVQLPYIISPSLLQVNLPEEHKNLESQLRSAIDRGRKAKDLDHGISEKIAYQLAANRFLRLLQPIVEKTTHPYTPPELERIQKRARLIKLNTTDWLLLPKSERGTGLYKKKNS